MRKKVVIIGHSYSSRLSLVRAVAQADCEVTVVATTGKKEKKPEKPVDAYSRYVSQVLYCNRKDETALISLLLEQCKDPDQKVVLIPDGDDIVATIDKYQEALRPWFYFPYIAKEPASMQYWMEKDNQKRLAREIGLNVTNGTVIDILDGQYTVPDTIHYPCFPKPLATMNGGKGGMRKCDDQMELEAALEYIAQKRNKTEKVLVEDYKEIDTEYALLGFSDGKEVIIPGVLRFMAVSKQNKGIALQGKVMPVNGFEVLLEQFKQLVLQIGFVGVFDIDFYQSDGLFYFCELNLRYGGSGYAITKMGVNLPAMMVKNFYGEPLGEMNKSITNEAIYVNDRMCMADWDNGYITSEEYKKYLYSADIRFVPDENDPDPESEYRRIFARNKRKNAVRRLLKFFRV